MEKITNLLPASLPMTPPNSITADKGDFYRLLAKIIIQCVSPPLKDHEMRNWYFLTQSLVGDLGDFAQTALDKAYPWSYLHKMVEIHVDLNMYHPCISFAELQQLYPCEVLSDSGALSTICDKVLSEDPKAIADYKKGKLAALNHLKGKVMKETKGKADIQKVEAILKEKMI